MIKYAFESLKLIQKSYSMNIYNLIGDIMNILDIVLNFIWMQKVYYTLVKNEKKLF